QRRSTGPNQFLEVSFKSWLVSSLAADDELLRATPSAKKKPGLTEPGLHPREYAASKGHTALPVMSNNQISSGPDWLGDSSYVPTLSTALGFTLGRRGARF